MNEQERKEQDSKEIEAMKRDYDRIGKTGSFWKPKDGANIIRILPRAGTKKFYVKTFWHYNIGQDRKQAYACPDMIESKPCPICEKSKELYESKNPEDKKLAKDIFRRERYFFCVIDRKNPDAGPQIYGCGPKAFAKIFRWRWDEDGEGGDFTDLNNGFDIVLDKAGTGRLISYNASPSRKKSSPMDASILENLPDLGQIAVIFAYEDLQRALAGENIKTANREKEEPKEETKKEEPKEEPKEEAKKEEVNEELIGEPKKEEAKKEDPVDANLAALADAAIKKALSSKAAAGIDAKKIREESLLALKKRA